LRLVWKIISNLSITVFLRGTQLAAFRFGEGVENGFIYYFGFLYENQDAAAAAARQKDIATLCRCVKIYLFHVSR
jgi:hypothetical protein